MTNREFYNDENIVKKFLEVKRKDALLGCYLDEFTEWCNDEVVEVLDKQEKKYLRNVVLPFYDKVVNIAKVKLSDGREYIRGNLGYGDVFVDTFSLPCFLPNEMYVGMEFDREYTLKELGIKK